MSRLYANTKFFHFPERLAAVAEQRLPAPIHIRLKPTNRCNHRCSYCCYRNPQLYLGQLMREQDQIPPEKMAELVRDFISMGVKAVTFSGGGEPLCYPHIQETISALGAAGIKVAMLSNGGLLSGEVAELLAAKATWLRISMDAADAAGYAASRGVGSGEFSRVCANLEHFAARPGRRCVLGLNLIVTRENSGSILDFLKLTRDLGVDHVKVSGVVVSTEPAANDAYHHPFYPNVRRQLDTALACLPSENFAIIDLLHEPGKLQPLYQKDYHWCPMCRFLLVIGADSQIYTCQDKAYTTSGWIGSLAERSFAEFWQSDSANRRLREVDPARECSHHCVAHQKNLLLLDYFESDPDHLEFV